MVDIDPCAVGMTRAEPPDPLKMGVQVLDPAEFRGWDQLLRGYSNASFFHSAAWASVLRDTFGYKSCYFVISAEDRVRALLPTMQVETMWTARRGVSLPFTDRCPLLALNSDFSTELFSQAIEYGRQHQWHYIELRDGSSLQGGAVPSVSYLEHVIPLCEESGALARMKSEVRTAIRRAERERVSVKVDQTLESVRAFYKLHCRTRRRHGLPPQPFVFFENIWKHALRHGMGAVFLAAQDDRAVAGAIFLCFANQAIFKFGASDETFQQLRGNNLIFWEAIKRFKRQGYSTLHLGRTALSDHGLRRFKLGWGAEEQRLEYCRYDLRTLRFVPSKDRASGWHNALFRRLPVTVNRMAGALIYRHMG